MKKEKNLIENKDLINTFKNFQLKTYLNKTFKKKNKFFFLKFKFKKFNLFFFKRNKFIKIKPFFKNSKLNFKKNLLKSIIMFINYIFIFKYKPNTQTQRFKTSLFQFKFKNLNKFFKIFFKNKSGRNNQGKVTVFSKGKKIKYNSIALTKLLRWDKKLIIVNSIFKVRKKLYTLNKHITGSFSINPYISGVSIGQHLFFSNFPKKFWLNNLPGSCVMLKFLTKYCIFSNLFVKGVKKYSTSNGTFCQVLEFFYDFNLIKIILPSKQTKILLNSNFAYLGSNSQSDYKYTRVGKAGFTYFFGKKSKVRGVARNPVDHPHGGRTKTNQPEVSIWGWVAKKNK